MSINRVKKEDLIKKLTSEFEHNPSFYLLDFNNMPVAKSVELRKKLRENEFSMLVIKNRLALRALSEGMPEEIRAEFRGPTALAFAAQNPIGLARLIREFSIATKLLKVKAAVVEGRFMPGERFEEISKISSREELVARFCSLMAFPLVQLLRNLKAPVSGFGSLLQQLKTTK